MHLFPQGYSSCYHNMVRRPYVPPSRNLDNAESTPSPWIPGKHLLDQHLLDSDVTEFVDLSYLRAKVTESMCLHYMIY